MRNELIGNSAPLARFVGAKFRPQKYFSSYFDSEKCDFDPIFSVSYVKDVYFEFRSVYQYWFAAELVGQS